MSEILKVKEKTFKKWLVEGCEDKDKLVVIKVDDTVWLQNERSKEVYHDPGHPLNQNEIALRLAYLGNDCPYCSAGSRAATVMPEHSELIISKVLEALSQQCRKLTEEVVRYHMLLGSLGPQDETPSEDFLNEVIFKDESVRKLVRYFGSNNEPK